MTALRFDPTNLPPETAASQDRLDRFEREARALAALRHVKEQGLATAAVVNVHTSSMAREADVLWPTHAGPA